MLPGRAATAASEPCAAGRARCAPLVELWDRDSAGQGKGRGEGGGMDMPRFHG